MNYNGLFRKYSKEIDPEELTCRWKTKKTATKLYDQRDSFRSEIVWMPFFNSNMPFKIFYSSIGFDILGLVRNTSEHVTFIIIVNKIWAGLVNKGAIRFYKCEKATWITCSWYSSSILILTLIFF